MPLKGLFEGNSRENARVMLGAGERNRTVVISLEGMGPINPLKARSDKWALNGPSERKRLFSAVRTTVPEAQPDCCSNLNAQTDLYHAL